MNAGLTLFVNDLCGGVWMNVMMGKGTGYRVFIITGITSVSAPRCKTRPRKTKTWTSLARSPDLVIPWVRVRVRVWVRLQG